MSAFSRRSGDIGYYNGPNPDISGFENVFVCTMRLNQGGIDVTTYARAQTSWVAQHLGFSSEYVFNGPFDAYSVGVAFAQQCLFQFIVGKSGILIDCEDEGATGTHSWGPDECIRFAQGVRAVRPDIPVSAFFCYMNYTVNRRFNWSPCVGIGMGLVYARPGGPDDFQYWPAGYDRYIKQDGTVNGIDADWHNPPWLSIIGGSAPQPIGDDDMASQLYLYTPTNDLIWADHLDMTLRKIDQNTVERLQMEALLGLGKIYYIEIGEPSWSQMFGSFRYITMPNVAGNTTLTDAQLDALKTQIVSAIPAGASGDDVKTIIDDALKSLTLKSA